MSRFNTSVVLDRPQATTTNLAGGEAFEMTPKTELASMLLTSFTQDQYYRSADDGIARLIELQGRVDPIFAAKAAIYARNEFGMRSITHVVAAEIAASTKGEQWTKDFVSAVIRRPDDMTEILAYYLNKYGKPVPNALKKGLAKAFDKFDAYQLAKYRGEGKAISLVDVVNLVRPRPTKDNTEALKQLVNDKLRSSGTWETKLSAAGSDKEAKADAWRELVSERKIGYFALLRNLRNISEQAPDLVLAAAELLVDEKLIRKSLVLPFRLLVAKQEVQQREFVSALSKAIDISLANVPKFDGTTLVAIDHSGSMGRSVAGGTLARHLVGDIFATAMFKQNPGSDVLVFGTSAGLVTGLNPDDSTLSLASQIGMTQYGHGTNFQAIFEVAQKSYDRVVIFSDEQAWVDGGYGYSHPGGALHEYKGRTGANPAIFCFDLAGYGSMQFPENKVFQIAGFSDKTFDLMQKLETDRNALVNAIEAVTF